MYKLYNIYINYTIASIESLIYQNCSSTVSLYLASKHQRAYFI